MLPTLCITGKLLHVLKIGTRFCIRLRRIKLVNLYKVLLALKGNIHEGMSKDIAPAIHRDIIIYIKIFIKIK